MHRGYAHIYGKSRAQDTGLTHYSLNDRKDFVLWAHAWRCFRDCVKMCDLIANRKLTLSDPLYMPITVAAVIGYGKPFKGSHGLGRLPNDLVPAQDAELHAHLIRVRDKIVAHLDTGAVPGNPRLHSVRIEINKISVDYLVEAPKVHPDTVTALRPLAEDLAGKAHYRATKHVGKLFKIVYKDRTVRPGTRELLFGEYLIDIQCPEGGITKLKEHEKAQIFWD